MVNHQLEFAQRFAQRILYLSHGQLEDDVIAQPNSWLKYQDKLIQAKKLSEQEWQE